MPELHRPFDYQISFVLLVLVLGYYCHCLLGLELDDYHFRLRQAAAVRVDVDY